MSEVTCPHCGKKLAGTSKSLSSHLGYWHKELFDERKVKIFSMVCKECGEAVANSNNNLAKHLKKIHAMTFEDYLVKHEYDGKKPVCACGCGQELVLQKGGYCRFATKSCASQGENNGMFNKRGPDSPNWGKVRTEEHKMHYSDAAKKRWEDNREKMAEIMQSDDYRQKQRDAQRIVYDTTNHAEKVSRGIHEFWSNDPRAPELRKLASDRAIELLEQGKIGPRAPFKTEWVENHFTGKQEYMHSSWEKQFLEHCFSVGIPVTKAHSIRIPYIQKDGTEHVYVPDFVTTDDWVDKLIFEVKGQRDDVTDVKDEAARRWCDENGYQFIVVGNR
jgi:hypothetical protein